MSWLLQNGPQSSFLNNFDAWASGHPNPAFCCNVWSVFPLMMLHVVWKRNDQAKTEANSAAELFWDEAMLFKDRSTLLNLLQGLRNVFPLCLEFQSHLLFWSVYSNDFPNEKKVKDMEWTDVTALVQTSRAGADIHPCTVLLSLLLQLVSLTVKDVLSVEGNILLCM